MPPVAMKCPSNAHPELFVSSTDSTTLAHDFNRVSPTSGMSTATIGTFTGSDLRRDARPHRTRRRRHLLGVISDPDQRPEGVTAPSGHAARHTLFPARSESIQLPGAPLSSTIVPPAS